MISVDPITIVSKVHAVLPERIRRSLGSLGPIYWAIVRRGGERIEETPWGAKMKVDYSNRMEFRFANGTFEEALVNKIRSELNGKSLHIADIGANTGYYTLLFNSILRGGMIDAFEPNPRIIERLKTNVELNDDARINIHECAISESEEELELTIPRQGNIGMATLSDVSGEELTVRSRTLDQCFVNCSGPDVLKIDIEGGELELVRGGTNTLKNADTIILELHADRLGESGVVEVFEQLSSAGFSTAEFIEEGKDMNINDIITTDLPNKHPHLWIQ